VSEIDDTLFVVSMTYTQRSSSCWWWGAESGAAAQSVGCGKMDGRMNVINEKKF